MPSVSTARKAVNDTAKRTRRLHVRLRERELAALTDAARKQGVYLAEFIRDASLAAARVATDSDLR